MRSYGIPHCVGGGGDQSREIPGDIPPLRGTSPVMRKPIKTLDFSICLSRMGAHCGAQGGSSG